MKTQYVLEGLELLVIGLHREVFDPAHAVAHRILAQTAATTDSSTAISLAQRTAPQCHFEAAQAFAR
jgi:hypothetical protein